MKRDFTIGAAWSAAASLIEQGAGMIVFLLIARLIGAEGFGIAAMTLAFLLFGEFLVRDTITEAIVERRVLEEGRLEATFFALIGFSLAIAAGLIAIAPLVGRIYQEPTVTPLLIAASPTVLMVGAAGVSTALLRRNLAYRTLALRSVVGVVCGGVVGVAMAARGLGAWSLVGQRLTEVGINSAFAFRAAGWMPRRWPTRAEFALVRGLGPKVVLLRSISLVIAQTPVVALGIAAEPRAAGLFACAWRLVQMIVQLIVKPIQGVAQSAIAELRRQHASTAGFYLDLVELAGLGAFCAFVGLALIGEPLIAVLLGWEWRGAGAMLPALCLAGGVMAVSAIQEAYVLAIGRMRAFVSASAWEAAIGVAAIAVASRWGPVAIGYAVALRALAALPLRTAATLAPEVIAPRRFILALVAPVLLAGGVYVPVALWRFVADGRMSDVGLVGSAVAIGVAAAAGLLFGLMPRAAARLRSFVVARPE
ncbi:MAG: oligosaccharide flippase family protein [Novosphingobium sp.]